jgi:hypothetical protein
MPGKRVSLMIEFELDTEPIAGALQGADGLSTAFDGWIQLVSLLQEAATTRSPQPDPSSNGKPPSRRALMSADPVQDEGRLSP